MAEARVDAESVKELRHKTGAAMMDCKRALEASEGDFGRAVDWLKRKGAAKAVKKMGREASEGVVHSYVHSGRVGVMLEVNSETDFVARNPEFKEFVQNVALHIAAMGPEFVEMSEMPQERVEAEKKILKGQNLDKGKKPEIVDKIVEGQIKKWASELCLMDQKYVKDPAQTVRSYVQSMVARVGENIVVRRFVRWELGESA